MFRECYFEYAGISSEPYNLILCYVSNSNEDFDSGGKFELKTDTLPRSHETLLYGKDYSAEPLTFGVEIVNYDDYIPLEQMNEIKNWLFGQDGWKLLRLSDERQNYFLKCIFEPGEDIVDGIGYRGVRCTLHNVSPFWYGDEKKITFSNADLIAHQNQSAGWWCAFEINVNDECAVDCDILPTIIVSTDRTGAGFANSTSFKLVNTDANNIDNGVATANNQYVANATSWISYSHTYMDSDGQENATDVVTVSSKYMTFSSQKYPNTDIYPIIDTSNPLPSFRLHKGINICRIYYGWEYDSITIKYTPTYRLGAF